MTLDDFRGFVCRVFPLGLGAAQKFLLQLRRDVVEKDRLLARVGFVGNRHMGNMFLISSPLPAGEQFRMLACGGILGELINLS
jgi:hypothetical protein